MRYKLHLFLIVIFGLLSLNISEAKDTKKAGEKRSPIRLKKINKYIDIENKTITTFVGEKFKWEDYLDIQSANDNYNLICFGKYSLEKSGSYQVKLILTDEKGYSSCLNVNLNVEDKKEEPTSSYSYQDIQNKLANIDSSNYLAIAQNLVGMRGYCSDVANAFLQKFYNDDSTCYNTYDISEEEAKPGDIIYYADGGLGVQHYAIYLGNDKALQGNFEGIAQIKGVRIKNASEPQFKRAINH